MPRKTDKRNRLVEAAKVLIHQQGFNLTTLADIAQEADVPLGNVYYYFKTKEAIGVAVIEKRSAEYQEHMNEWSAQDSVQERLLAFVDFGLKDVEQTARFGCPVGGLCQELGKQGGPLADLAAKLLHDMMGWAEKQFASVGYQDASIHAAELVAQIQGMFLLTHTFKDPKIAQAHVARLREWVKAMLAKAPQSEGVQNVAIAV